MSERVNRSTNHQQTTDRLSVTKPSVSRWRRPLNPHRPPRPLSQMLKPPLSALPFFFSSSWLVADNCAASRAPAYEERVSNRDLWPTCICAGAPAGSQTSTTRRISIRSSARRISLFLHTAAFIRLLSILTPEGLAETLLGGGRELQHLNVVGCVRDREVVIGSWKSASLPICSVFSLNFTHFFLARWKENGAGQDGYP